jgi:hypothetical protein
MSLLDKIKADINQRKSDNAKQIYEKRLADWQAQHDALVNSLNLVKTFQGAITTELMLKPGEALFFKVTNTGLVEERRGVGHYEGRSSGFSVPLGKIRYRVGTSKGHFVQGAPIATAVDTGTTCVTNKRVIFQGSKQTRECSFDKLIGIQHDDINGSTTISVSNRQKPTTIHYGAQLAGAFDFRLDLALAHYRHTVPQMAAQVEQLITNHSADKPSVA